MIDYCKLCGRRCCGMRHGRGFWSGGLNAPSPVRLKILLVFRRDCRGVMIYGGLVTGFAGPIFTHSDQLEGRWNCPSNERDSPGKMARGSSEHRVLRGRGRSRGGGAGVEDSG